MRPIKFKYLALVMLIPWISRAEEKKVEMKQDYEIATFAGGCFWCMESPFDKLDGVLSTTSGYSGGHVENPTYEQVSTGETGHAEAVKIKYDPKKISYEKLLDVFWRQINPTTVNQQFVDHGSQYRSVIFYHNDAQKKAAEATRDALLKENKYSGKKIVTEIAAFKKFYPAEEYHQDYYKKNPIRYELYRKNSGRDQYLDSVWGKDKR